jgi:hypothetical protein
MTTIVLQVPNFFEKEHQDTPWFISAKLYESGKLTLGQAAEMAGMSKVLALLLLTQALHPVFTRLIQGK